jgi:class 3 adenylate cyclase
MMADLRGFTQLCETLAPRQVVTLLNNYLAAMTDVVVHHACTIDELIGDAMLVVFGAPIRHDDDARRAIACAVEMQQTMDQVNTQSAELGLPRLEMGIGLSTGEVVVGNIGSHRRAKYGVVRRVVHVGPRGASRGDLVESDIANRMTAITGQTTSSARRGSPRRAGTSRPPAPA